MTATAPAGGVDRARRMQQYFDVALDLDETGRAAFLAEACGEDLELRVEIEALLAALARARTNDLLPALLPGALPPTEESPAPSISLVGARIHNYQVDAAIASGGMADVYLAHHLEYPRRVAVKVLKARFSRDGDIVQRFLNEAQAANAVQHPGIIDIVGAGRIEGSGAPYILMEYLEGETLRARLRRGRLSVEEAVRIAIETAAAIAAAHDKGIVHRDLKPENIFLAGRAGAPPLIKVLDFGIAKLRADVARKLPETQVGAIMGTPQYMSPEHCRDARAVDHRTDIYSLGLILYEMVCERHPFPSAAGFADFVFAHVVLQPEAPRKLAPHLPIAIESVIVRCLAKIPEERYASMHDVVAALRAVPFEDPTERLKGPRVMLAVPAVEAHVAPASFSHFRRMGLVVVAALCLAAIVATGLALRSRFDVTSAPGRHPAN